MRLYQRFKEMPRALATLTVVFFASGLMSIVLAIFPIKEWSYDNQPVTYTEFWRMGGGILVVIVGTALLLLAIGFYQAWNWVRYAVPLVLAVITALSLIRPDPATPDQWIGSLLFAILSCWYFFWKRSVVHYFSRSRDASPTASP